MIKPLILLLIFLQSAPLIAVTANKSPLDPSTLAMRVEKLEKLENDKSKDTWDKLEAVSGIISGVIIALFGFYAANIYNRRQKEHEAERKDQLLSLGQADTLEKFLPHLISEDPRLRESSLLIIATLLGDNLATELAGKLGGEGSAAALVQIAFTSPKSSSESVELALGKVFHALKSSVVRIECDQIMANGFFYGVEGLVITAAHVAEYLTPDFLLRTAGGNIIKGNVVYINQELDLALIETPEVRSMSGVSSTSIVPEIGAKVVSLWHSSGGFRGDVANIVSTQFSWGPTQRTFISVTRMGGPGMSGAPAIDPSGKLVGVIHASVDDDDPLTILIPASSVEEGLDDYRSKG